MIALFLLWAKADPEILTIPLSEKTKDDSLSRYAQIESRTCWRADGLLPAIVRRFETRLNVKLSAGDLPISADSKMMHIVRTESQSFNMYGNGKGA